MWKNFIYETWTHNYDLSNKFNRETLELDLFNILFN